MAAEADGKSDRDGDARAERLVSDGGATVVVLDEDDMATSCDWLR